MCSLSTSSHYQNGSSLNSRWPIPLFHHCKAHLREDKVQLVACKVKNSVCRPLSPKTDRGVCKDGTTLVEDCSTITDHQSICLMILLDSLITLGLQWNLMMTFMISKIHKIYTQWTLFTYWSSAAVACPLRFDALHVHRCSPAYRCM